MTFEEERRVCKAAVERYGAHAQTIKAIEELAELQHALCRHLLCQAGHEHVHEELADAMIVIDQLLEMFDSDAVLDWREKKLLRLQARLDNGGGGWAG